MSDSSTGASGHRQSRRAFLGGVAGVGAGIAVSTRGSAQSTVTINDPGVVREIEMLFEDYNRALTSNDVAALNGYFFDSPLTVRFGNGENLYGMEAITAYRASVTRAPSVVREHTVITTYGTDFATVAARNQAAGGRIGRTMQTWVRFAEGWRIVAAHVSSIEA